MTEPWIATFTGKKFYPLRAEVADIDIHDIAHALSNTCRYAGHCKEFYSVAEHSVRLCDLAPRKFKFHALMHDAQEAYILDMPHTYKGNLFVEYQSIEEYLMLIVATKFSIEWTKELVEYIHTLECRLLASEVRELVNTNTLGWYLPEPPLIDYTISPWTPHDAESAFMDRFKQLHRVYKVGGLL